MPNPEIVSICYHWTAGSLPPPGYYEYTIVISATGAVLDFLPDYSQHFPPRWVECFPVPAGTLAALTDRLLPLREQPPVPAVESPPAVGGASEYLEFVLADQSREILSAPANQLQLAYAAVRAKVPHLIWKQVFARRDAYMDDPNP